MPRITLWGFLQYDKTLFDGLDLPTGCDPEILKDTIIMESGDLFPYYQHPVYLKANIRTWFRRMLPQFQKSFDALALEYVANENYDRYEDYSDTFKKECAFPEGTWLDEDGNEYAGGQYHVIDTPLSKLRYFVRKK